MLNLKSLLEIPYVDPDHSFDIANDGDRLAYAWNGTGKWEITLLSLKNKFVSRVLNPGSGSRVNPKFSPVNPDLLVYAVDHDGSENFHLLLYSLENGSNLDLTPGDTLQPNFSWSPDGKSLAFISNRTGNFEIYILDLPVNSERQNELTGRLVSNLKHPVWDVSWSPDGSNLACCVENTGSDYAVFILPAAGGKAVLISDTDDQVHTFAPCWNHDGSRLFFQASREEYTDIGSYYNVTKNITWLSKGSGDDHSPMCDTNNGRLVFIHEQGAKNSIMVKSLIDGSTRKFEIGTGIHSNPRFSPDDETIVFMYESPRQPSALYSINLLNGEKKQLTFSETYGIELEKIIFPKEITYPSRDGSPVPALLFYDDKHALTGKKAVVIIHGGPGWHYAFGWDPFLSHLASRGWLLLAPNYRGSTGYGKKWHKANIYDLGGADAGDIAAGADYLLKNHGMKPEKITITGRSYGGYLAIWCAARFPELWGAASGVVPFFNWMLSHFASREDLQHWNIQNLGDPEINQALWNERSTSNYLENVNVPVQIICGGLDPRCPASDSIVTRNKLVELNKTVDFHLFPDEGHTFLKKENIFKSNFICAEFLADSLDRE